MYVSYWTKDESVIETVKQIRVLYLSIKLRFEKLTTKISIGGHYALRVMQISQMNYETLHASEETNNPGKLNQVLN